MRVLLFLLGFSLLNTLCFSQKGNDFLFKINEIKPNHTTKTIDIYLNALKNGRHLKLDASTVYVIEKGAGISDTIIIEGVKTLGKEKREELTVSFLMDLSGSMRGENLNKAKEAIKATLYSANLPENNTYFSSFHNVISKSKKLNKGNYDTVIGGVKVGLDTDLYRALKVKIAELKPKKGKRVLILLTDGKNDIARNPVYKRSSTNPSPEVAVTESEILGIVSKLDSNFQIFTVGLGGGVDTAFLKRVAITSKNDQDGYKHAQTPKNIKAQFNTITTGLSSNYIISVIPSDPIFKGEQRSLRVQMAEEKTGNQIAFAFGSTTNPLDLSRTDPPTTLYWVYLSLIGVLIVGFLFAALSLIIPLWKKWDFRTKYVNKYKKVKVQGLTKRDPLTGDAFKDNDLVVTRCRTMTALSSWEYNNNQCPNYPDCMNKANPCSDGGENIESERFFSQEGIYKKFNWLWFGSLGGFIAWVLLAIAKNSNLSSINQLLDTALRPMASTLSKLNADGLALNTSSLALEALTGGLLGLGLVFTLAWVEEKGQARRFSWGRILFRTILGAIISLFIFPIGFLVQYAFLQTAYLGGLFSWILFGLVLGAVLSIKSSISFVRGILAGIIASLIAYQVYYLLSSFSSDFDWAKMVSFIVLGGLLGYVIVSVVSRLEDFELEYLSPQKFRRVNPISKWLKAGIDIYIGTDPSCYVFIKWSDEAVKRKHAKLSLQNGTVYIEPFAETLLNGVIIPTGKSFALKSNDIIQLGKTSISRIQYKEKRSTDKNYDESYSNSISGTLSSNNKPRPKIKIKKRN